MNQTNAFNLLINQSVNHDHVVTSKDYNHRDIKIFVIRPLSVGRLIFHYENWKRQISNEIQKI